MVGVVKKVFLPWPEGHGPRWFLTIHELFYFAENVREVKMLDLQTGKRSDLSEREATEPNNEVEEVRDYLKHEEFLASDRYVFKMTEMIGKSSTLEV